MLKRVHWDDDNVATIYHLDDNGRTVLATERWQDCEAILDDNKRMQAGERQVGAMRLTSQIPLIVIEWWLREAWQRGQIGLKMVDREFDEIIFRKLKDPDWKWLRTEA